MCGRTLTFLQHIHHRQNISCVILKFQEVLKNKEKFWHEGPQDTAITTKITEMVCVDLQPLTIVDDIGYRRLVSHSEERYEMVSRKTLSTVVISKIVRSMSEKISGIVTTASTPSVTSDIWTSKSGNNFISVTVHFIDADWQFQHLLLEVWLFSGESHTAANIDFRKWELKIVAQLKINSVTCMVRKYLLLERLCEQRHALALPACQSLNLGQGMELANQDWELVDILVKIFKLFWEATKTLSGEQSTVADCIPVVNSIKTSLQSLCGEQRVKIFANELRTEMNH
ncbi:hypothetical protein PR048_018623 [Dryococelus australis]|uniref:Uncharacterized protein n=1 Tax=Dryococelus australis TaxID=614101 RepID=A0ABQ9HCR5_9NEOP|nr:hypothetical protein PR048_018623 [Dryococelus australis]